MVIGHYCYKQGHLFVLSKASKGDMHTLAFDVFNIEGVDPRSNTT